MFSSVPHLRSIRRSNTAPVQPTAFASFPPRDCSCCCFVVLRQRIPLRRASQGNLDLSIGTHELQQTTSHHQTAPDPSCTLPKPSTSSSVFCFVFFLSSSCASPTRANESVCVCVSAAVRAGLRASSACARLCQHQPINTVFICWCNYIVHIPLIIQHGAGRGSGRHRKGRKCIVCIV